MSHPRVVNVRALAARWDVYAGRGRCPRTGATGVWGNPFTFQAHGPDAMRLYLDAVVRDEHFLAEVRTQLPGRVLGCWCAPRPCHAEVLARIADGEDPELVRALMLRRVAREIEDARAADARDAEHRCYARGCRTPVPPRLLMCGPHWRLVPPPLQAAVWATYRPGQEITKDPSRAYLDAAEAAIRAVAEREGARGRRRGRGAAPAGPTQGELFGAPGAASPVAGGRDGH